MVNRGSELRGIAPIKPARDKELINELANDTRQLFLAQDFNPLLELIDLARSSDEDEIRLSALKELCKYYAPQIKAREDAGIKGGNVIVQIVQHGTSQNE